jgi:putative transcriptional regulator
MKRRAKKTAAKHDWSRLDAMTAAEKHAAALSDPDNRPLSEEGMRRMKRTPRAKLIRRALGLSQEDFAARYHIDRELGPRAERTKS